MSASAREIELGKRKIASEEFVAICQGHNVFVSINSASLASLQEKSTKRFSEYDLAQYRQEIDLCGKMTNFQTRAVILQTTLSILQDRLHVRPQIVDTLIEMLNTNILPELPALTEANDRQIMTDLLDSIDPSSPKLVSDLPTIPTAPNNNESRRILQLRAPTQAFFIFSAYQLQQILPLIDLSVALALEITGLSIEPFSQAHHDQAHPHQEAIETCSVIRNVLSNSQFINKYIDKIKESKDNETVLNSLVVPESFSEVPDLHGAVKSAVNSIFNISRKEVISGDSPSQADDVYSGVQVLSYIHFYSQLVINVLISFLQSIHNRVQYIMMNAQLFNVVLNDVDCDDQQDLLTHKVLQECGGFTTGLHLVESLDSTNEYVSFLAQITDKVKNAIIYEQALYLHIIQVKAVRHVQTQQAIAEQKKEALTKRVEALRAEGKEAQAQKILDAQAKAATKETTPTIKSLPLGVGTQIYYNTFMSFINRDHVKNEYMPLSIILSLTADLITRFDSSFGMMLNNVINVSSNIEVKLPKGTRDISQEQMLFREKAFDLITRVFKEHGAGAIDTPVFERREILTGKYGEDSKLIFDLADQGGEMLSLRYDLTVPFARFCASNKITNIKRFHIGKVYRRDQPIMTKGRFREFYQCDFDIAGEGAPMCNDSEVIGAMIRILKQLPIGKFKLKLSHRSLLDAIMTVCGVPSDKLRPICSAIDKLDKEPWSVVKTEMCAAKGLSESVADQLGKYCLLPAGSIRELLVTLKQDALLAENPDAQKAFTDLDLLDQYLTALNVAEFVSFDLSLARGLDYYTGVIFEAVLIAEGDNQVSVGSIGAGGRYDKLVGMFSGQDVPAVGASIGLERILAMLEQRERAKAENKGSRLRSNATQVLVASNPAGNNGQYNLLLERIKLVGQLRDAKICAEYVPHEDPNIRKQAIYAEQSGIPIIVWIGVDELSQEMVSVKILTNNAEDSEKPTTVKRDQFVTFVRNELNKLKGNEDW
jgi:histidyl-tRNA synthetase